MIKIAIISFVLLSSSLGMHLVELDRKLFLKINGAWTNPVFDVVLPYFRDSVFWAPLYLFIFVFVVYNYGKKGFAWSVAFLCTVAVTDLIGTYVFKQNFERLRPCQDPFFFTQVRLLVKQCSGSYSFLSNHAANHFGLATFTVITFPQFKPAVYFMYLWAFLIAYAQVYVGVHYPADVLAGGLLGISAGAIVASLFHKSIGMISLDH